MGILKRTSPWEHSYQTMWRREQKFLSDYRTTRPDMLCSLLEERVPSGLTETLHQAFFRAFSLLFEKGEGIVRWAAGSTAGGGVPGAPLCGRPAGRPSVPAGLFQGCDRAGQGSVVQAGVQGVGLGLLGIGLPDIPLFTLTLLKTIRETAVSFGFAGTETDEQVWILRLIEASLSSGTELEERNRMLNQFIQEGAWAGFTGTGAADAANGAHAFPVHAVLEICSGDSPGGSCGRRMGCGLPAACPTICRDQIQPPLFD